MLDAMLWRRDEDAEENATDCDGELRRKKERKKERTKKIKERERTEPVDFC